MTLDQLHLLFFKNYDEASLAFSPGINCFIGDNGSGKTNLLDAIHYLAITKSAFAGSDAQSIKQGADFFVVKGKFSTAQLERPETIQVSMRVGQKKIITHDKQPYDRLADHIGRYPAVLISPYDTDLIRQGSEDRRRYFDSLQSQLDHDFLELLIQYNGLLRQRNATLKQGTGSHGFDALYLQALDDQLAPLGESLSAFRVDFLAQFIPVFQRHYAQLADGREQVVVEYKSQLTGQNFRHLLLANERRDLLLQRSTTGPHRDDFIFLMDGLPVKSYASQGQQKSFAIALKLAQFDLLANRPLPAGTAAAKPLLLLDDIFDRLDDKRIARLLQLVADQTFGQVFLTDTNLTRTDQALAGVSSAIQRFEVQAGKVAPL
ncbi:DNA replication and repair protein RecF [Hymenobacter ginsengisoli]|uniref:DNA replication and repair protein RecF n=1 Tax=Hymenobacter ginsengisoli TaxID=1051626 RepID=A0ABP8QHI4_9BACT|nr:MULTISPECIES: DNA replication/repair protein RecF [unclassified Hymenobacter]MBO2030185.1 DNA replication/repair protein RecF [Hymenobacter sp. BT559]